MSVPVYVYRRRDGSTFETVQRMVEDALIICPTSGQSIERVLQPFSPRYKGTGFYTTDYRTRDATTTSPGECRSARPHDPPERDGA